MGVNITMGLGYTGEFSGLQQFIFERREAIQELDTLCIMGLMHCPLLTCIWLVPCTFHFEVMDMLLRNHTPPACGVVPNRHSTIDDGLIDH